MNTKRKEFIACLGPQVPNRVARRWWERFQSGLAEHAAGHPSFLFIYDFTEQLCESHELPGTKRREIRRILTQVYRDSGTDCFSDDVGE